MRGVVDHGVFNNVVVFDPHAPQNSLAAIVPDLAKRWVWSEDGKRLTFALREGVTWHDGKPFTAAEVKCTWDLLADKGEETFKVNFRKGWYSNVVAVTINGTYEAVFNLKKPQPAILPCSPQALRRFIPAMFRRATCAGCADRNRTVQVRRV